MAEQDETKDPSQSTPRKSVFGRSLVSKAEPAPEAKTAELGDETQADEAVDDIMKKDGDEMLKAQDEIAEKAVIMKQSRWERFRDFNRAWWASPRKRYGTIGVIVLVIAALFGVPFTRYNILGLVLKAPVTVQVVDSKSGAPVSGATVELGGKTAQTESNGKATLHVNAGSKTLQVSKKYYQGTTQGELVALSGNSFKAAVVALGRQVDVKIVNKVTGKPVAGASVSASGANAKTDASGLATLVVPSGSDTVVANVSLNGYNKAKVNITAAGPVAKNSFSLTPAGKLYFLSNLSGKIDVVKTNLDGTDRQTVLAGTGSEDPNSTSLLASRDWKYLALLSKRSGDTASVYLIDTTNDDKLTTVDQGNASFSFIGWSGDKFIYQLTRNTVSDWQPNQEALKSLDATTGQTLLLDQTQGTGTGENDFVKQSFGSAYIIGNQVVYAKDWYNTSPLNDKQAELDSIGADGSSHKVVKSFGVVSGTMAPFVGLSIQPYEPTELYVGFNDGTQDNFYDYENGTVTADTTLTNDTFYSTPYPTYLLSPSGNQTFWSEQRDGKNTLLIGDANGKSQKQIATLSDYNTYGWYTDNYLLVSKNSSELYIMPVTGGTPFKLTDYYKPATNYNGYGGGYGGL